MSNGISAIEYHERTKHTLQNVQRGSILNFDNKPRLYKIYENVPQISLEDSIPEPSTATLKALSAQNLEDSKTLDKEILAGLCYYAAGITKTVSRRNRERHFRAAACTGALYHIDLYLVCGDLDDLNAGVYHYDPQTNSLDILREDDYRGILYQASGDPNIKKAPVTFIATSTWWRNAWKYEARTYRHAFWDSGTILANLLTTAQALNLSAKTVLGFADRPVANLLGIDPKWEAPLELIPVGNENSVPKTPKSIEPIDPSTKPLESDPQEYPLIYRAWKQSTLSDGDTAYNWSKRGERPVNGRGAGDRKHFELESVEGIESEPEIYDTIHRRNSCREYKRDTLSFQKVSTVLDIAIQGLPMDVREKDGDVLQFVDCYCIVNDVKKVDPGAYQYHPDRGELELLHSGKYRKEAGKLALNQQLGADAGVCIYFMSDLDAITEELGDRGYRVAQLEAALNSGRLYLATYTFDDLGGTGLTFFDDMVTDFFKPRAKGQTPMFLYTLGRPA